MSVEIDRINRNFQKLSNISRSDQDSMTKLQFLKYSKSIISV